MLTAKDIMTKAVFSVREETDIKELAALFVKHRVTAMPVVDTDGKLVGMVSQTDLVEQDKPLHIPTVISLFDWVIYLESEKKFQEEVRKVTARKVGEICSRQLVTCVPQTPLSEIASLMVDNKVHLVPVLEDDVLVGVVARLDLIRSMGD
jgi:CBS-domain-containing membrane protein